MSTLKVNQITDLNDAERFNITSGTAVASTSGTSITFSGIPSWVKRITVMFNGVSTNSANASLLQLGTGGSIQTTGYKGRTTYIGGTTLTRTDGIVYGVSSGAAGNTLRGSIVVNLIGSNAWVADGVMDVQDGNGGMIVNASSVTLSGAIDSLRLQAGTAGTETFDAGTINILYEG
jgi:hypothetical protein